MRQFFFSYETGQLFVLFSARSIPVTEETQSVHRVQSQGFLEYLFSRGDSFKDWSKKLGCLI